ncbi:MAG: ribosomal-protein-alanine N-acetyltransferase [Bacteroidia bacterium]|nr:ribosomal-protein-alanine N-acetyltransferase [Bacteroidia bacterium]
MNTKYEIRLMIESDLEQVTLIENEAFLSPWRRQDLLYELNDNPINVIYVLEIEEDTKKKIVGFIDFMVTFSSSTISQIAIAKEYRRKGYAKILLDSMLKHLKDGYPDEVETITLEVRKHNTPAIAFYEKNGFEAVLIKPHYYDNGDDAIYMIRRLI